MACISVPDVELCIPSPPGIYALWVEGQGEGCEYISSPQPNYCEANS